MLRMVNHMVDSYLELRRLLTRQLEFLQQQLFDPRGGINIWRMLLESRNALHQLEDICEDQRAAIVEWIDALDEWPEGASPEMRRDRELLRVRSRDVSRHRAVLTMCCAFSLRRDRCNPFSAQHDRTNETCAR